MESSSTLVNAIWKHTQNLDGDYKKYLNIQSVAGTSAGGSTFAMAGAVSVLYSATDTEVSVGANSDIMTKKGGNVSIFLGTTAGTSVRLVSRQANLQRLE